MRHWVSEVELKNGARGLFIDIPGAAVTTYELNFRAGEFLVPHNIWEAPHLMEHMVAVGASEQFPDRRVFQSEIAKHGAYTNAYTSYYSIGYVGEVADFEWERVMRLQRRPIEKPLFLQTEFEAEFGNVRDELTSHTNDHFRTLSGELSKAFGFKAATDEERLKLIKNVKLEDLVAHHKRTHFCRNLRFVVAGSLRGRRVAMRHLLEELELPKGGSRFRLPEEKPQKPQKPVFIANDQVPNIYLIISSQRKQIIGDKDNDALSLARILLTDTLYSRIFGQARDNGLVYHVSSGHHIASRATEWWLSAQVLPENAPALCDIILTEIKKVQKGIIDEAELENARQYALGSHQRSLQTVSSVAEAYSRYFFDGHIEDLKSFPARIKALTANDVAKAMCAMFADGIGDIAVLGGNDRKIVNRLQAQLAPLWKLD